MRNRNGFALVETLMDGVAIGALVAILALLGIQSALAFPRWTESREESRREVLRWDLENVIAQQALHRADEGHFAASLSELDFEPSSGVVVDLVVSSWGWSASAAHEALGPGEGCAVYLGSALPPHDPVRPQRRGEISCTE